MCLFAHSLHTPKYSAASATSHPRSRGWDTTMYTMQMNDTTASESSRHHRCVSTLRSGEAGKPQGCTPHHARTHDAQFVR